MYQGHYKARMILPRIENRKKLLSEMKLNDNGKYNTFLLILG